MLIRASRQFFYRHPGQVLLALVGVAAGVAVMTGVALLRDVLLDSLDAAAVELAGGDSLSIRNPGGFVDESLFSELARRPGAPELVPVLRVPVRLDGRRLEVLGIDPFALGPDGRLDIPGALAAELVAEPTALTSRSTVQRHRLAIDRTFEVTTGEAGHRLVLHAVLEHAPGLDDRLVMDIAQAQAQFGYRGRISELLAPGAARDWLEARMPPELQIVSAADRRASARQLTAGMRANLGAMSLLAMATGLFVVFSVLGFLMVQRRREFGILRALGVTRGRLAGMLSAEAAALGALGGLVGLVAGTWMAGRLLELVRGPVAEIYRQIAPAGVAPTWGLYAAVWVVGVAAACAVVVPVVREAMAVPPGRLVRGRLVISGPAAKLAAAGAATVVIGVLTMFSSAALGAGLAGLFLILGGLVMLVPVAGFGLLGQLRRVLPDGLARRGLALLDASGRRLAPAMAALTLAVALAAGMGMMILGFRVAVDDWVERLLQADLYVSSSHAAITPELADRVAAVGGVEAVSSVRSAVLSSELRLNAYDLPAPAWAGFDWIAGNPDQARIAFSAGTAVLLSEPLARRKGLAPGDRLAIPAPGGTLEMEVAAVFRDYSTDQGFAAIDGGVYRDHFGDPLRDSLGIYRAPGVLPDDLENRLRAVQGTDDPELNLTRPDDIRAQTLAVFDRTFRISWALAALVGLIALVALTSALLALGLERGRDYATLRALGLPPRQLARLVTAQTGAVALVAALLAVPLAVVIHLALTGVVQPRAFGWTVPLGLPPLAPLAVASVLVIVAGSVAGLYPAWRISTAPPAANLRAQ